MSNVLKQIMRKARSKEIKDFAWEYLDSGLNESVLFSAFGKDVTEAFVNSMLPFAPLSEPLRKF